MEAEGAVQMAREANSRSMVSNIDKPLSNGAQETLRNGGIEHQKRVLVIAGSDSSGGA